MGGTLLVPIQEELGRPPWHQTMDWGALLVGGGRGAAGAAIVVRSAVVAEVKQQPLQHAWRRRELALVVTGKEVRGNPTSGRAAHSTPPLGPERK